MRGARNVKPEAARALRRTSSNATSTTMRGSTLRYAPSCASVCASSQMLSSEISVSGSATDARPIVARRPERSSRTAKVQSERRARRRPSPGSAPTMTQSSVSSERFTLSQPDPRRPGAYGACGAFTTKPSDPRCRDVMKAASIPSTPQTVSCVAARKTPPLFASSCSDSSAARRSRYEPVSYTHLTLPTID
jgi:hypothetical protein